MTKRRMAIAAATVVALTAGAARGQEAVNVSFQYTIHGVQLQMADEKGWWAQAGIKPGTMTPFVTGAQQVAAVAAKTWDIGLLGGPPALLGASRFNLQTVLILLDDSRANGVVARSDLYDALKSDPVKTLKGKQYLVPVNSTSDYAAQSCMAKAGLKPGDVAAVNIAPGAIVDAFKGGEAALGAVWAPHFLRLETQAGGKLWCTGKEGGATVTANMVVRPEYLKDNLDTVARFTALYLRGLALIKTNKAESLQIMKRFYDKGGVVLSPDEMEAEIDLRDYWTLDEQLAKFDRSKGPSEMDKVHTRLSEFFKAAGTISEVKDPRLYVNPTVLEYIAADPKLKAFAEGK